MADDLRQAPGLLSDLWRCERDLREQFNHGPRLRHAFLVRAGLSADGKVAEVADSIERGLKWGMGADRFESPFWLHRLRGELWEFFMADRGVSENEQSAWYDTWESLDRIVLSPEFRSAFPSFQDTESWLPLVYRLAWTTIDDKPVTVFYDFESGNPGNTELTDFDKWEQWMSGHLQLSRGEHFVYLRRDIRKCSLDALRSIINCTPATPLEANQNVERTSGNVPNNPPTRRKHDRGKKRMPKDEANIKARDALKGKPTGGGRWTIRKLADAIGCSAGLVNELAAWQVHPDRAAGKSRQAKPAERRSPLSLDTVAAVKAGGSDDPSEIAAVAELGRMASTEDELQRLIAEHKEDFEPSPTESTGRPKRKSAK